MFRIRQQYWFCLAGLCLVGSLVMLWSGDIDVVVQPHDPATHDSREPVFRRLTDLPARTTPEQESLADIPLDHMPFETKTLRRGTLRIPSAVPSRRASILNSPIPTISRDQVTPAGFQNHTPTREVPNAVWLSGHIESLDSEP